MVRDSGVVRDVRHGDNVSSDGEKEGKENGYNKRYWMVDMAIEHM
jgi:hypothetical protein